ncbi:MAG: DNA primase [Pseudolabrys sp.]|nr:DNA primase [Pseudolabrys sp.]
MRFSQQFIEELKARLPVSEVVGRRVKLTRAGREFKGLSPFNKEKTPSFFVNDQKQAWFDFSSGQNGSIFDFVMRTDGVTFPEAVERLAQMAGMPLPVVSREDDAREKKRKTLYEVMELAAQYFQATLAGREGAKARGYLADRELDAATQLKFRLGYATGERFALKEHLGKQGIPVEDMTETGLLIHGDDIPVPYDRFRDRVMFPITDIRGRIIAFGGRALDKEAKAKYLNSPETTLFHKGHNLYNGAAARQAAHQGAPVVVVEGYVDVIAMVNAGFPGAVAPLGTALTEDQLALIWKMHAEPVLCFDGDGAGKRAAYRAVDLALPKLEPGKSLRFAMLPEGQDPDDLLRSGGREAVADVVAQAKPLADVAWLREVEAGGFDTPERRAALEARLDAVTRGIGHEAVRKYYRQDFEARLRGFFQTESFGGGGGARGAFPRRMAAAEGWRRDAAGADPRGGRGMRGGDPRRGGAQGFGGQAFGGQNGYAAVSQQLAASPLMRGPRTAMPLREALILQTVLNHPWLLHDHLEELSSLAFRHNDAERLKGAIIDGFAQEASPDAEILRAGLIRRGFADMLERLAVAVTTPAVWGAEPAAAPADVLITWQQLVALHRQWHSLTKELKDAEAALADDATEANQAWLFDVKSRIAAADGTEALIEGFGASSGRPSRSF